MNAFQCITRSTLILACTVGLPVLAGCGGGNGESPAGALPDTTAAAERARAAAAGLMGDLGQTLFATLDAQGPAAAMRVCSEVAQGMTATHAKDGVDIRRVSDRYRNPVNAPDEVEAAVIAYWREVQAAGGKPGDSLRIGADAAGAPRLELLRPIVLGERCVVCHGAREQIPAEVQAVLAERYPEDRATGFVPGELRGAISVRIGLE